MERYGIVLLGILLLLAGTVLGSDCVLYPLYLGLIAYSIISAYLAGIAGFWNLFWTAYFEMFLVNLGDFFGLDWFFREKEYQKIDG